MFLLSDPGAIPSVGCDAMPLSAAPFPTCPPSSVARYLVSRAGYGSVLGGASPVVGPQVSGWEVVLAIQGVEDLLSRLRCVSRSRFRRQGKMRGGHFDAVFWLVSRQLRNCFGCWVVVLKMGGSFSESDLSGVVGVGCVVSYHYSRKRRPGIAMSSFGRCRRGVYAILFCRHGRFLVNYRSSFNRLCALCWLVPALCDLLRFDRLFCRSISLCRFHRLCDLLRCRFVTHRVISRTRIAIGPLKVYCITSQCKSVVGRSRGVLIGVALVHGHRN